MKRIINEATAIALARIPKELVEWFEGSLSEEVQNMLAADTMNIMREQGRAQVLDEICQSIKNAKATAEKLGR